MEQRVFSEIYGSIKSLDIHDQDKILGEFLRRLCGNEPAYKDDCDLQLVVDIMLQWNESLNKSFVR